MQDSFIDRLVDETGQSRETVETRLKELSQSIRGELDDAGRVNLEGIGTIRLDEGEVVFEPAPELSRHCNSSYESLRPVVIPSDVEGEGEYRRTELLGDTEGQPEEPDETGEPVAQAPGAPEEETDWAGPVPPELPEETETSRDHFEESLQETPFELSAGPEGAEVRPKDSERELEEETGLTGPVPPELPEETETAPEPTEAAPVEASGEKLEEADEQRQDVGNGTPYAPAVGEPEGDEMHEEPEWASRAPIEGDAVSGPDPSLQREEEAAAQEEAGAAAALRIEKDATSEVAAEDRKRNRRVAPVLIGLFVVAAVAALIYLFLPRASVPPAEQDIAATQVAPDDVRALDPDEIADPDEDFPPEPAPIEEPEEPPPAENGDPLRADAPINVAAGGFTWIYASLASRNVAEQVAEDFRQQGYRTGVIVEEAAARTFYRVGVGQFQTSEGAIAAQNRLPPLPDNTPGNPWLRRIQ